MKRIYVTLEEEEAIFFFKDGKVHCEGYDLESERTALALTRFGKGVGVLLVAINTCCKNEKEFVSEAERFAVDYGHFIPSNQYSSVWPKGQLLFEYFSYSPDSGIRWGGMEDARLTERHYERMLKDPDLTVKVMMASFPKLPEKYFYALSRLSQSDVNYFLAINEHCPIDVMEILFQDKDRWVRMNLAENPACPENILELLAQDEIIGVRIYITYNSKCPIRILELLAKDKSVAVNRSAWKRLASYRGLGV